MGDFNKPLSTDKRHVGPCTVKACSLGYRGPKELQKPLETYCLLAAGVSKPAIHMQENSVSQIDYVLLRIDQSQGPGRECKPQRQFEEPTGEKEAAFPLKGEFIHCRIHSAEAMPRYDQQAMEDE